MNQLLFFLVISMVAGFLGGLFTRSMKYESEISNITTQLDKTTIKYNRLFRKYLTDHGSFPEPLIDAEWHDGEVLCFTGMERTSVRDRTPEEDSEDGTA